MADKTFDIAIKVKATSEDAALSLVQKQMGGVSAKLKETAQGADQTKGSFGGLGGAVGKLAGMLGGLAILTKVTGWMKEGTLGAIAEERAIGALSTMVRQFDPNVKDLSARLEEYADKMKKVGMEDDLVYQGIRQLIPVTKDYENSTKAVGLAWDVSVAMGIPYQQSLDLIAGLIANNPRSLKMANRELGVEAKTCQEALDNMFSQFDGYSGKINDHLTEIQRLKNGWEDFWENVGGWILNAWDFWTNFNQFQQTMIKDQIGLLSFANTILPDSVSNFLGLGKGIDNLTQKLNELKIASQGVKEAIGPKMPPRANKTYTDTDGGGSYSPKSEATEHLSEDVAAVESKDWATNYKLRSDNKYLRAFTTFSHKVESVNKKATDKMIEDEVRLAEAKKDAQFALAAQTSQFLTTVFGKNKAAASAAALIDAFAAAAKNNAAYPQPYGGIMAALALAIGMAQVQQIQSAKYSAAGGFDIPSGINPIVQTHAKEMILPQRTADMFRRMEERETSQHNIYGGQGNAVFNFNAPMGAYGDREIIKRYKKAERHYNNLRVK